MPKVQVVHDRKAQLEQQYMDNKCSMCPMCLSTQIEGTE